MSHQHQHSVVGYGKAFKIGIAINVLFIVIEVLAGFASKSTALLADAGHNLSDVLALAFSWFAILVANCKPNLRFTYGLRKTTIQVAILNTLMLIFTVGFIAWESIQRLNSGQQIHSQTIVIIASLGILVNGFTAYLFVRGKDHDLNIKSSFLHFVADALVSFGVVVAGVIIFYTGCSWVDSMVSLVIAIFILYSSYRLLIDSINLSLDAVPKDVDILEVIDHLKSFKGVVSIHDLHIWALSTSETALTVHIVTDGPVDENFLNGVTNLLKSKYNINHTTIQIELENSIPCSPCN